MNKENISALQQFNCIVCLDTAIPSPKILQCPNGHLMCEACYTRLRQRKCPTCRVVLGSTPIRALLAEQMIEQEGLLDSCRSCDTKFRKGSSHICPNNAACPLQRLGACDCDHRMDEAQLIEHLRTVHHVTVKRKEWNQAQILKAGFHLDSLSNIGGIRVCILEVVPQPDRAAFRAGEVVMALPALQTAQSPPDGERATIVQVTATYIRLRRERDGRIVYSTPDQLRRISVSNSNVYVLIAVGANGGVQIAGIGNIVDMEAQVELKANLGAQGDRRILEPMQMLSADSFQIPRYKITIKLRNLANPSQRSSRPRLARGAAMFGGLGLARQRDGGLWFDIPLGNAMNNISLQMSRPPPLPRRPRSHAPPTSQSRQDVMGAPTGRSAARPPSRRSAIGGASHSPRAALSTSTSGPARPAPSWRRGAALDPYVPSADVPSISASMGFDPVSVEDDLHYIEQMEALAQYPNLVGPDDVARLAAARRRLGLLPRDWRSPDLDFPRRRARRPDQSAGSPAAQPGPSATRAVEPPRLSPVESDARRSTPELADSQPSAVVDAPARSMSPSPQPVADADAISANRLAALFEANPEALADLLQRLQRHAEPGAGNQDGVDVRRALTSILTDRAGQADMAPPQTEPLGPQIQDSPQTSDDDGMEENNPEFEREE